MIEILRTIRLLALDVDGVLTDGGVYMFEDGSEFRRFNIKDGLGLKRVMEAGIHVALISAGQGQAVQYRAIQLGISEVHTHVSDKLITLQSIADGRQMRLSQVAYMGDDLTDLAVIEQVGWGCCPADAVPPIKAAARWISQLPGGYGAVRELCDLLVANV